MLRKGDKATLWGIECDESSPLCGEIVCPVVNLWNATRRNRVVARLPHDTSVEILNIDVGDDHRRYYRVRGTDDDGNTVSGWVSQPFVREKA